MTATPVGGEEASTYEVGPYTIRIAYLDDPDRITLQVHRAWWPLW